MYKDKDKFLKSLDLLFNTYKLKQVESYPYSIGAATFHPYLIFYHAFYQNTYWINRCLRAEDARIDDCMRSSIHHQLQVILVHTDGISLFKEILQVFKIKPTDIVLKSDKWNNPSIASWGYGYEVYYKNIEICQITYFVMLGGRRLLHPIVEFAFGLERLYHLLGFENEIKDFRDVKVSQRLDRFLSTVTPDFASYWDRFLWLLNAARTDYRAYTVSIDLYNIITPYITYGLYKRSMNLLTKVFNNLKRRFDISFCCEHTYLINKYLANWSIYFTINDAPAINKPEHILVSLYASTHNRYISQHTKLTYSQTDPIYVHIWHLYDVLYHKGSVSAKRDAYRIKDSLRFLVYYSRSHGILTLCRAINKTIKDTGIKCKLFSLLLHYAPTGNMRYLGLLVKKSILRSWLINIYKRLKHFAGMLTTIILPHNLNLQEILFLQNNLLTNCGSTFILVYGLKYISNFINSRTIGDSPADIVKCYILFNRIKFYYKLIA